MMAKIYKDKYIFGMVKVGERGQIVIPKEARRLFNIKTGDRLLVVGDINKGIGISKIEGMKKYALKILGALKEVPDEEVEGEMNEDQGEGGKEK